MRLGLIKGMGRLARVPWQQAAIQVNLDAEEFINLLHGSDLIKVKLDQLEKSGIRVITLIVAVIVCVPNADVAKARSARQDKN